MPSTLFRKYQVPAPPVLVEEYCCIVIEPSEKENPSPSAPAGARRLKRSLVLWLE